MSLNKSIEHHKEYRKPYNGSKAFDRTCRNHGSCIWCMNNRMYRTHRLSERANQEEREFKNDD